MPLISCGGLPPFSRAVRSLSPTRAAAIRRRGRGPLCRAFFRRPSGTLTPPFRVYGRVLAAPGRPLARVAIPATTGPFQPRSTSGLMPVSPLSRAFSLSGVREGSHVSARRREKVPSKKTTREVEDGETVTAPSARRIICLGLLVRLHPDAVGLQLPVSRMRGARGQRLAIKIGTAQVGGMPRRFDCRSLRVLTALARCHVAF